MVEEPKYGYMYLVRTADGSWVGGYNEGTKSFELWEQDISIPLDEAECWVSLPLAFMVNLFIEAAKNALDYLEHLRRKEFVAEAMGDFVYNQLKEVLEKAGEWNK